MVFSYKRDIDQQCRPELDVTETLLALKTNNTLPKHAYSIYTENFTTKNENYQIKNSDIVHVSAQNIDCGRF